MKKILEIFLLVIALAGALAAAGSLARAQTSSTELKLFLPEPRKILQFFTPGGVINEIVEQIRNVIVPAVCEVPNLRACNVSVADVADLSNNFTLNVQCGAGSPASGVLSGAAVFSAGQKSQDLELASQLPSDAKVINCSAETSCQVTGQTTIRVAAPASGTGVLWTANWQKNDPTGPCQLTAQSSPAQTIGSFRGKLTARLNMNQLGKVAVLYQLYDRNGQFCTRAIAHAFRVGTPPLPGQRLYQSAYRMFNNADSVTPGSALAAQDTAATITSNSAFRLRMLIHVDNLQSALSGQTFKLQQGTKVSTCAAASYSDVTASSGAIRYNDNATPADGDALGTTANDPVHSSHSTSNQTYEEANNFSNTQGAIAANADGHWDFSLTHFFSGTGFSATNYCLRAVISDGTVLDNYLVYPEIDVTP